MRRWLAWWIPLQEFLRGALRARAESGVPVWRQLAEALLLRLPPGRLGLTEYHDYRLHEARLRFIDKLRYVGSRGEPYLDRANDRPSRVYADDKILLDAMLESAGVPRPRMQATYLARAEPAPGAVRLITAEALADWLRLDAVYPLFAKPAHAGFGCGAFLIEGYDASADRLLLAGTEPAKVDCFVAHLPNPGRRGYLFQEALAPHPALAALQCGRLSSLRVMTLGDGRSAPQVYRAIWKVPRRGNIVDNFEGGRLGNLLGQVDLSNGRVLRVIQGHGLDLRTVERHPDSQLPFAGLVLPDWQHLIDVTLKAASLLPGFRFQHWDIALTERGPVPLEINLFAGGGTELSQLIDGYGLLEPRLLAVVRAAINRVASSAKPAPRSPSVT